MHGLVRIAAVVLAGAGLVTGVAPSAGADPARRVDRAALDAGLRAVVAPGGATAALGLVREDGRTLWKGVRRAPRWRGRRFRPHPSR
ncbi:hypothetical protein, partial [Kitasatospora sp. NPDC056789]|uniref:hypothetical protein n=1 Tax=Kitasatospora sp. NPDC056789 TaxID=3345945 RepID=UPI0036ADCADA